MKIYEQAQNFREIGAGVAFAANAVQCMSLIDPQAVDALKRIGSSNGDPENLTDYLQWLGGYNPRPRDSRARKCAFQLIRRTQRRRPTEVIRRYQDALAQDLVF